jgi:prevent-host-death family protein
MVDLSLSQARVQLDALVRRAASDRERFTITTRGRPAAVLVNAEELADLEEALGLAQFQARRAAGEVFPVPQAEVRQKLGVYSSEAATGRPTA